jgi:hypothetical protein
MVFFNQLYIYKWSIKMVESPTVEDTGIDYFISSFITDQYPPVSVDIITKGFTLFNILGKIDLQDKYIDLLSTESDHSKQELSDIFIEKFSVDLFDLISEFGIMFNTNVTIGDLVLALESLVNLGQIDDIVIFAPILESIESAALEQTITILSMAGQIDILRLMQVVDNVNNTIVDAMTTRLIEYESALGDLSVEPTNRNANMEISIAGLKEMFKDRFILGLHLLEEGIPHNLNFMDYVDHLRNYSETDTEGMAINIFSLLVISRDGCSNPYLTYKKYSDKIFNSLRDIDAVDKYLRNFFVELEKIVVEKGLHVNDSSNAVVDNG